jgi:hypothetical protein
VFRLAFRVYLNGFSFSLLINYNLFVRSVILTFTVVFGIAMRPLSFGFSVVLIKHLRTDNAFQNFNTGRTQVFSLGCVLHHQIKNPLEMFVLQNSNEMMSQFTNCITLRFNSEFNQVFNLTDTQSLFLVKETN